MLVAENSIKEVEALANICRKNNIPYKVNKPVPYFLWFFPLFFFSPWKIFVGNQVYFSPPAGEMGRNWIGKVVNTPSWNHLSWQPRDSLEESWWFGSCNEIPFFMGYIDSMADIKPRVRSIKFQCCWDVFFLSCFFFLSINNKDSLNVSKVIVNDTLILRKLISLDVKSRVYVYTSEVMIGYWIWGFWYNILAVMYNMQRNIGVFVRYLFNVK